MPYITVESGSLSDEQKEELIKRLTEVSSEIMKVPQEFFVTTIKELPDKNFGIGEIGRASCREIVSASV